MDKVRYNWNAVIAAASYLTDEPAVSGLEGNGFAINRVDSETLSFTLKEGSYEVSDGHRKGESDTAPGQPTAATPETPNPSIPAVASESAATSVPTETAETPTVTGQVDAAMGAVPTGQ